MDAFTEDWNASQFWYSDETATLLARQLLQDATDDTRIAVVSAPSAFIQLKNLLASQLLDSMCCISNYISGKWKVPMPAADQPTRVR